MKKITLLRMCCFIFGILIAGGLQAADGEWLVCYQTLAHPDDRVVLAANETAVIVGTVSYDWSYNWMNILYKQGTNNAVRLTVQLGLNGGTMPLSGPGVIMLATNNAATFGADFTGAVGLKIVRTSHRGIPSDKVKSRD